MKLEKRFLANRVMHGLASVLAFVSTSLFWCVTCVSRFGLWIEEKADAMYPDRPEYMEDIRKTEDDL